MSEWSKFRMLEPVQVAKPAIYPVSLAQAKAHVRVDFNDDDDLINALIDAATQKLDGWNGDLGLALITQDWRTDYNRFPDDRRLPLPLGPVQAVTVRYHDSNNAEQTMSGANYTLHEDGSGWFLWLDEDQASWPGTYDRRDAVRVTTTVGYGPSGSPDDGSDVPQAIRQAILLLVGHWYEHREQVVIGATPLELPIAAEALLVNYRRPRF